jgi:tyrosinase
MVNLQTSPGDPLFYLHHAYLDKVWWNWQSANLSSRLYDISGTNVGTGFPSFGSGPSTTSSTPTHVDGDPGNVTTLGHVLHVFGIIPNATINDVMDIRAGYMCYNYVEPSG